MATVPISVQLFDAFLGSQEGIHSVILPDIFSSGGSKNLWIDKYGRAKRILGYTEQNAIPVTTNTGGSATLVRSLYAYRKTSGGSVTRQLLGVFDDGTDEIEIWRSTDDGATWTFTFDWTSFGVGQIPDFAQMGDTLIITTGKLPVKKWNGTTFSNAGGTQSPTVTSAAGTSGVLFGTFKWKLVSVEADGSRHPGSVASSAILLSDVRASLSWTADADTDVVGYELYRTTGTGEVYYYVDTINGRTTVAYTDNTADLDILENRVLEEHGDAPPQVYFAEPHRQRMWYFRTDANPQRGYWSDPGNPESVLATNFLDFSDAETQGDFIVGGLGDFEGMLIVFEERSIWTVSGTGEIIGNISDWTRTRTNAQTGAVSIRTVARVPAGARYADQKGEIQVISTAALAYLTPNLDIRLFDGDNDVVISYPKRDQLLTINYSQRAKAHAVHDPSRGEVTWMFPVANDGEPTEGVTWNYRWGIWYEREWPFSCALEQDSTSTAGMLLGGSNSTSTGGKVFLLWNGNSFNGSAFRAQWMTKTLYGTNQQQQPAISNRKRWRWGDFLFQTESNVTLNVSWLEGDSPNDGAAVATTQFSPATATLRSADGDDILTADSDFIASSADSIQARVQFKDSTGDYLHHRGIRLRIFDEDDNGSWSLEAMAIAYQILPGLQKDVG